MTEQQTITRGREALQLLESPLLKEVWDGIENEATEALVACSMLPNAKEERDALIWHLKMVRKQKAVFFGMVKQGEFSQRQIDTARAREESRVGKFFRGVVNG